MKMTKREMFLCNGSIFKNIGLKDIFFDFLFLFLSFQHLCKFVLAIPLISFFQISFLCNRTLIFLILINNHPLFLIKYLIFIFFPLFHDILFIRRTHYILNKFPLELRHLIHRIYIFVLYMSLCPLQPR